MSKGLKSLIEAGTKVWLDSIDPDLVRGSYARGVTGATSNPIIIANLIKSGRFDQQIGQLTEKGRTDEEIAWELTDMLVRDAQEVFLPAYERTQAEDGYVSFELDPLLEDPAVNLPLSERSRQYIELGKKWSQGHRNRMIKVPATPGGIAAMADLAAAGVTLNVTLIFTQRQYEAARTAIWAGAQKLSTLENFKSVYSIFISRVDVYTEKHVPQLSPEAQGQVGIVIAKRMWRDNVDFWTGKKLPHKQEIVFASTGTKKPEDDPIKYAAALAGSDIETNPPETNDAIEASGVTITRAVDKLPPSEVLAEIDREVDMAKLEETLMREGITKFADPQKALIALIREKRATLKSAPARR
jgi:transaldolase